MFFSGDYKTLRRRALKDEPRGLIDRSIVHRRALVEQETVRIDEETIRQAMSAGSATEALKAVQEGA